jgi:hypothetical protein
MAFFNFCLLNGVLSASKPIAVTPGSFAVICFSYRSVIRAQLFKAGTGMEYYQGSSD